MGPAVIERPFSQIGQHISHSQVSLIDRCELAWWFKYVRGIIKPPTVHMLTGQCYHKSLALNFNQKKVTGVDLPMEEIIHHYNTSFDRAISEGNVELPEGTDPATYRDPVGRLLAHYLEEYVLGKMEPILVEQEFVSPVPGCDRVFAGITDVQLIDGRMIDFKCSSRRWSDADALSDRQSTAYAMLIGYDLEFEFHIGLKANKNPAIQIVKLRRTRQDVDQYVGHLRQVVARMKELEDGESDPVPYSGFCNERMCQYYSECNRWRYGGAG